MTEFDGHDGTLILDGSRCSSCKGTIVAEPVEWTLSRRRVLPRSLSRVETAGTTGEGSLSCSTRLALSART